MKNILEKINETGTLLIEAIAMLGLVSLVTPVLYKKAAERTAELQDINASTQLRAIATAMDAYLTDNFAQITAGSSDVLGADFSAFDTDDAEASATIDVSALSSYLPYGMMNENAMRATKLFDNTYSGGSNSNYNIVVVMNQQTEPDIKTLTGFVIAKPKTGTVTNMRSARIASMIGSNGGYVSDTDKSIAIGTQGVWSVATDTLDSTMSENTIVISSLQPISSQGLNNEKVLHRVNMPNDVDQQLNTMETDLFMGKNANDTRNIRMVNQIVMQPTVARMAGQAGATHHDADDGVAANIDNALYIGNGGGANVMGKLQAINQKFVVSNSNNTEGEYDPSLDMTMQGKASPTFHVSADNMTYGNPGGTMQLVVNDTNLVYKTQGDAGTNMLNVENSKVEAVNKTLTVGEGFATLGAAGANTDQQKEVPLTEYGDDRLGTTTNSGEYRLTVDGSVYAKDTVFGGKVAAYDADSARLRAGIDRNNFDAGIEEDNSFYMKVEQNGNTAEFSLRGSGHSATNAFVYASSGTTAPGFTVNASNVNGGVDLIAGDTPLLIDNKVNNNVIGYLTAADSNDEPQANRIRMGAADGIYLSTYTGNDSTADKPVSIQGTTMQVYEKNNKRVIDNRTNKFYVINTETAEMTNNPSSNTLNTNIANNGEYYVEGMEFNVGRREFGSNGDSVIDNNDVITLSNAIREQSILNIQPAIWREGWVTSRFRGGVGFYDLDAPGMDRRNPASPDDPAAVLIDKGKFEIRATEGIQNGATSKGDLILAVDNNMDVTHYSDSSSSNYGSVYVRKGSINLDTNRTRLTNNDIAADYSDNNGSPNPTAQENMKGYIAADRFISHYTSANDISAIQATAGIASAAVANDGLGHTYGTNSNAMYDRYEVNPAYTSVMHDIKLTTRGGARLSDILPDFINKGIYVVDTNYAENSVGDWTDETNGFTVDNCGKSAANGCKEPGESGYSDDSPVSAYVGFVPTPKCPPGYAKVITLTPAGWAMAQAGRLIKGSNDRPDIAIYDGATVYDRNNTPSGVDPNDPNAGDGSNQAIYLDYQKSTWLRSEVRPVYSGKMNKTGDAINFNGWGLIMGFIYPVDQYQSLYNGAFVTTGVHHGAHSTNSSAGSGSENVYWNLFPVYKSEIEGYATVYCYFDRFDQNKYNPNYVDRYNQLKAFNDKGAANVDSYNKGDWTNGDASGNYQQVDNYNRRLNDERLKYKDPW